MGLKDYFKEAQKLIAKKIKDGDTKDMRKALNKLARDMGVQGFDLNNQIDKIIKNSIDNSTGLVDTFSDLFAQNITQIKSSFDDKVFEIVRRGLIRNDSFEKINSRLRDLSEAKTQHLQTLQNTIESGGNRASVNENAISNGCENFKLVGPSFHIRPWCAEHLNKTYSIAEIKKMDNGQGLPVWEFCGGYNCDHHWLGVR